TDKNRVMPAPYVAVLGLHNRGGLETLQHHELARLRVLTNVALDNLHGRCRPQRLGSVLAPPATGLCAYRRLHCITLSYSPSGPSSISRSFTSRPSGDCRTLALGICLAIFRPHRSPASSPSGSRITLWYPSNTR